MKNKELKNLPKNQVTLVKVTFRYDWRKEAEPTVIGLCYRPHNFPMGVWLDYPYNISKDFIVAKTLGIYNSYEYIVEAVTAEEEIQWRKAVDYYKSDNKIIDFYNIKREYSDKMVRYVGVTFKHEESK